MPVIRSPFPYGRFGVSIIHRSTDNEHRWKNPVNDEVDFQEFEYQFDDTLPSDSETDWPVLSIMAAVRVFGQIAPSPLHSPWRNA